MAEYKRKKVKKTKIKTPKESLPVKKKTQNKPVRSAEKITMKPKKRTDVKPEKSVKIDRPKKTNAKRKSNFKFNVIKGFKKRYTVKSAVIGCTVLGLALIVIILSVTAPVGLFEAIGNRFVSLGSDGGFPKSISGGVIIDVKSSNDLIYALSDTDVDVFNRSGKLIYSFQHGFSNPALKISDGRSLVYEIGGNGYTVFNLTDNIISEKTEFSIISGDISRDGTLALATKSQGYTSQVEVFNKDGSSEFVWYSSNGTITDLALSANGKRLAVGVMTVANGAMSTTVNILDYSGAKPITSYTYSGAVYSLSTVSSSLFSIVTESGMDFCSYKLKPSVSVKFDYGVSVLREDYGDYSAVVTHRAGNKSDNKISVYSTSGKLKYEINYTGNLIDFAVCGNNVYCLSDSEIIRMNSKGEVTGKSSCSFSVAKIGGAKRNGVCVISDTDVNYINFD